MTYKTHIRLKHADSEFEFSREQANSNSNIQRTGESNSNNVSQDSKLRLGFAVATFLSTVADFIFSIFN